MSEFNIEVQGGSSVRLPTAGKYCDRDIIVTASGGGTEEIENIIDQSGVLESTEGTVEEKVEALIDKASWERHIQESLYNLPSNEAHTLFKRTSVKDVSMFDFSKVGTFNYMFLFCNELEHIELDMSGAINAANVFQGCSILKTVKLHNTAKNRSLASAFANCTNLISVETLDCSSITTYLYPFSGCNSLVTLKFVPETIKASIPIPSPVLSDESLHSIIDGLATLAEDATAQTLTLSKNLLLTEEQKQAITTAVNNKGWTLAFA